MCSSAVSLTIRKCMDSLVIQFTYRCFSYYPACFILLLCFSQLPPSLYLAFSPFLRALCTSAPQYVAQVVASLTGSLSSLYEQHRVITCSFFAEVSPFFFCILFVLRSAALQDCYCFAFMCEKGEQSSMIDRR